MHTYRNFEKSFLPYVIASQVIPNICFSSNINCLVWSRYCFKNYCRFLDIIFPIVIGIFDGLKINSKEMENMLMTIEQQNLKFLE